MVCRTLALVGCAVVWVPKVSDVSGSGGVLSIPFGPCLFVLSSVLCPSLGVAALLHKFRCALLCPAALAFTALLVGYSDFFLLFLATLLHPFLELPFLFGLFFFLLD